MSDSDVSSLSSAESIETDEELLTGNNNVRAGTLDHYFKNAHAASPPPKKKRPASPPHEYVLADNPDIAFIVMFRARFASAFPRSSPQFGPQDIERGVTPSVPDEGVEKLLCSLIGMVLNRKKDVERGHHQRALEEAVQTHANQWPLVWGGKNPLHGGRTFNSMTPQERLTFLKALILWSLNSCEAIQAILKDSYKQSRHEDDLNQPLSVQPWGRDGDKRRYWLIEGQEDTHFRLYRESNPALKHNTWWNVADSIESIKGVAMRLQEEGTQASKKLSERIYQAIPRFEAGEDKRKRREYRLARKAQFTRPEPGFSLYEGRTRGKRIKYTFSDEEGSDDMSPKHSTRQSGISTPAEPAKPTFTASGRQVKSRHGGVYGETMHSGQSAYQETNPNRQSSDGMNATNGADDEPTSRTRSGRSTGRNRDTSMQDGLDGSESESDAVSTGNEWDGGDDDDDVDDVDDNLADDDEDDEISEDSVLGEDELQKGSLVVSLRYQKEKTPAVNDLKVNGDDASRGASPAGSTIVVNGDSRAVHHPSKDDREDQADQSNTPEPKALKAEPEVVQPKSEWHQSAKAPIEGYSSAMQVDSAP